MANQYTMQDPTTQYPKLDIPEQRQDEPGLDTNLQPKADHGEKTYEGHNRLSGRKALITGTDSGIGAAVAIAFAREGADIALNCLPSEQEDADKVIELIKKAGCKAYALPGDISDVTFCHQLANDAAKALGGLDILVNNAGRQQYCKDILELDDAQVETTFKTNILGRRRY